MAGRLFVSESLEGADDVPRDGDTHQALVVVPANGHTAIARAGPVDRVLIRFLKGGKKVIDVVFICVLDAEVIHDECE